MVAKSQVYIGSEWSNYGQFEYLRRMVVRYSHGICIETESQENLMEEKVRKRVEEERGEKRRKERERHKVLEASLLHKDGGLKRENIEKLFCELSF